MKLRNSSPASASGHGVGRICIFLLACLIGAASGLLSLEASGQVSPPVYVELSTNFPESIVYADSLYLGRAMNRLFEVPASTALLWLIPPDIDTWSIAPISAAMDTPPGDTLQLSLNFQYHYNLESVPFEAQVFLERPEERLLLGETPFLYLSDDPLRGMLLVSKEGYEPQRFTPGEDFWNHHHVELEPESGRLVEKYWKPDKRSDRWIDVLVGSATIVSGIAAIRYKMKADRGYERYEESGDPTLRNGFERYDRYAAISLGTMQVGLGVLAVRFVIDR
jgi:hypothetical protein